MNTLEKDSGLTVTTKTRVYTYSKGTTPPPVTYDAFSYRRRKIGQAIPNFHARRRRGELLPHTHFVQYEHQGGHVSGTYHTVKKSDPASIADVTNHHGCDGPTEPYRTYEFPTREGYYTSAPDSSSYDYLTQQAAGRIYAQGMDALTFVSELPSLKRSLSKLAGTARRLLNNKKVQKQTSRQLLEAWLEGRYAWRTLGYDIKDFYEAVTSFDAKRQIHSQRVGSSYTEAGSEAVWSGNSQNLYWTVVKDYSFNHSLRGSVTGRISASRFTVNPLVTGWELLPLSFVLDWVYDVGTAIEAASFVAFSQEYAASHGSKTVALVTYTCTGSNSSTHFGNASVIWSYESTTERRFPSSINLLPQLTNRRMDPSMALDLSAIARLRGRFNI